MTLTDLVLIMTSTAAGPMKVAVKLADVVSTIFLGLLSVGFASWSYKIVTKKEQFEGEKLLAWMLIPALAYSLIVPSSIPGISPDGEGIILGLVKDSYLAVGSVVDRHMVPEVAKVTKAPEPEFTELAKDFRDRAIKVSEIIRDRVRKELGDQLSDPSKFDSTFITKHPTFTGTILALLAGVGAGVKAAFSDIGIIGKLGFAGKILTGVVAGGVQAGEYIIFNLLIGYAVDFVWRLVIILWYIKASAVLILAPISAMTVALEFRFGEGNVTRFLVNLLGIAITPLALVAILTGAITAYPIAESLAASTGGLEGFIFSLFIGIGYPIIAATVLLRVGEIISYVIGVSVFAMSAVINAYTRPANILQEIRA